MELHFAAGPKARNKPAQGNALGKQMKTHKSPEGARQLATPIYGFVRIKSDTQGCARASLALGWLVCAPLVLFLNRVQSSVQVLTPGMAALDESARDRWVNRGDRRLPVHP